MKDLTSVLVRPVITERSSSLRAFNQYVFEVNPKASKPEIRQAVETIFRVDVLAVRTISMRGKLSRSRSRTPGYTSDWKKAIVRLAPGQEIKAAEE